MTIPGNAEVFYGPSEPVPFDDPLQPPVVAVFKGRGIFRRYDGYVKARSRRKVMAEWRDEAGQIMRYWEWRYDL